MASKTEQRKIEIIASGKKFNASFKEMSASARILENQLKKMPKHTKEWAAKSKELKSVKKDLSGMRTEMTGTRKAMGGITSMFSPMALGIGAVIGVLSSAFNKIKNFEQAGANLAAVLGKNRDEITELTEEAKKLGATTAFTATEVLSLSTSYAKLGFSTAEILNVTEATLDLAAATGTELDQAATVAGGSIRAFGLATTETQRVVDVMAKSFSSSALDMEKYSTAMATVGPVARNAGKDIEWTTSKIGILTNNNIDASTAGTGLRNILLDLSDKGLSWGEAMGKINKAADKNAVALELFGKRGATVATVLAESATEADLLEGELRRAAGTAEAMADTQLATLQGRITLLSSAWDGFILSIEDGDGAIGSFVNGSLTFFTKALNQLVNISNIFELVFTDFADVSEKTKLKILEMGETIEGNNIAEVIDEAFRGITNGEILADIENARKVFVDAFVAEGESAEESAILFDTFFRQRVKGYWNDVQAKKDADTAKEKAEKTAQAIADDRERKRAEVKAKRLEKEAEKELAQVLKVREVHNKALEELEWENEELRINAIEDELERELQLIDLQRDKKLAKLNKQRIAIVANTKLTGSQKTAALHLIATQEALVQQESIQNKMVAQQESDEELLEQNEEFVKARIEKEKELTEKIKEEADLREEIYLTSLDTISAAQDLYFDQRAEAREFYLAADLARIEANTADEELALANKFANGEISQSEHDRELAKLQKEAAWDAYEVQKKQFYVNQKMQKAQAIVEIALAVAKSLASLPFPASLIPAGLAYAAGLIQIDKINKQQPPEAPAYAIGGITSVSKGGMINNRQYAEFAEEGPEWVSPNWMLRSPKYANTIMWLEGERQMGNRGFAEGSFTASPPSAPATGGQDNGESILVMKEVRAELKKLNHTVARWPEVLQVHNNVRDTAGKINMLNEIERDSGISRSG